MPNPRIPRETDKDSKFPNIKESPGVNYILNLQDKMILPNYRTWGHVNN